MNKNKIAKAILNDVYYKALGEVFKAKSGDTKMIFGKPFKYDGSKWVPSSGGGKKEEAPKKDAPKQEAPKKEFKVSPVLEKLTPPSKYEMDWERGLPKPIDKVHLNKPGVVDEMIGTLENYGINTRGLTDDKAILQSYNDMVKDIRQDALLKRNKKK